MGGGFETHGTISVAIGRVKGQGEAEAFHVFDHETQKLVIYMMNNKNLEILAVRDCSYDLGFKSAQYSPKGGVQRPTVQWMKNPK